ncbi:Glutamyl-tRNA(Gln) amidotransferase subunit A, chloroplastic/mitochondrial [Castellaniella defragrans]
MASLNDMTVEGMLALIRSNQASCSEVLRDHLLRIRAREDTIQAWSTLNEAAAATLARRYDDGALGLERQNLPLYGLPVGIKDVIDTRGLETAYGSPLYRGHVPRADAYCVARLKQAGALILGKNVTAEFAYSNPTKTRNPHDSRYTAGGSSSGSAAAVADLMVPVSISTQTGGSTIRPASYCGVVGFKPSFGLINRAGLKPLAESFDTIGLMARSVTGIRTVFSVLSRVTFGSMRLSVSGTRVGFYRTPFWGDIRVAYRNRLTQWVDRLAQAGCEISELGIGGALFDQYEDHPLMLEVEASRALMSEFDDDRDGLSDSICAHLVGGRLAEGARYFEAKQRNLAAVAQFASLMFSVRRHRHTELRWAHPNVRTGNGFLHV